MQHHHTMNRTYSDRHAIGLNRRLFLQSTSLALGSVALAEYGVFQAQAKDAPAARQAALTVADLPRGTAPAPVPCPHFPDRLHAFVWRNWQLVPAPRMAEVTGATPGQIIALGRSMGLSGPPRITREQQRRSALSVIRRNWHLLPYEQLLQLLGWTAEQMAFTLREDDFLYVKLGNLKPQCERLSYRAPDAAAQTRAAAIAATVRTHFPGGIGQPQQPLFEFVKDLSRAPKAQRKATPGHSAFSPKYCYSYFALYGDPLLEPDLDPYPDGYLARLAASGVDGVWLQAVLTRLGPFPWDTRQSEHYEARLKNLRRLVERAGRRGIKVYLYLNEPRACATSFFAKRPELKGVAEGDFAALCTSVPAMREWLASTVAGICRAAPGLGGFFTISASENLTNCWSHGQGKLCPRCGERDPAEVIAEVNTTFYEGIRRAGNGQTLFVWDWGWDDAWADRAIGKLPREVSFMSVSEWGMPINRGGTETTVGEYSISTIGPSERTRRRWREAQARGLRTLAKVQCGNTWELSAVPYIPAVANVARHAANLRQCGVNGLMLGWTLGGYPSPNLEVVAEIGSGSGDSAAADPTSAMARVAARLYGSNLAAEMVQAWQQYSTAFSEFPFHGSVVYSAPMQVGPANPLWAERTGYAASMVGFPYDHLAGWRAVYPPDVFISQIEKVAGGFEHAHAELAAAVHSCRRQLSADQLTAAQKELNVGEAAGIHFRSTANQARFVLARDRLKQVKSTAEADACKAELERLLHAEIALARRLHAIQSSDSRIGFEAYNQYYYVPLDLAEKVINCQDLLTRWLPGKP